jgi:hypothetical protein
VGARQVLLEEIERKVPVARGRAATSSVPTNPIPPQVEFQTCQWTFDTARKCFERTSL